MERKKTVSLCMIVKNEEKYLNQCLESVKDIVDEMIIVDTGSTDKTVDIAMSFNAKIIHYKWTNNFAEARNVSLEYATMDWILIMDGDDIFNTADYEKFIDLVNNYKNDIALFNTASFTGDTENEIIVNNMNIRLIRNSGNYRYNGAIHEQIIPLTNQIDWSKVLNFDIIIYHYGYLNEVAKDKNKRVRNISILEQELEKNPDDKFHLFNLANEYYALGDLTKALELYNKAYTDAKTTIGFTPKLILKRIETIALLGDNNAAINAIDDGLSLFPDYTDLMYQKALIYLKQGMYTLSITALEKCLEIGDGPIFLSYFDGVGSYRALETLGKIYLELMDYDAALNCYNESYRLKPNNKLYLYNIIKTLIYKNRTLSEDKQIDIADKIQALIESKEIDILSYLLDNGALKEYDKLIASLDTTELNEYDLLLLKGRRLFYNKEYLEALGYFSYLEEQEMFVYEAALYKTIIFTINSPKVVSKYIKKTGINKLQQEVLLSFYKVIIGGKVKDFDENYDTNKVLTMILKILREILLLKEFDLFQSSLDILNYVINNTILIELAKLYDDLGYNKLASQEVYRSIKAFSIIDINCINILKKSL